MTKRRSETSVAHVGFRTRRSTRHREPPGEVSRTRPCYGLAVPDTLSSPGCLMTALRSPTATRVLVVALVVVLVLSGLPLLIAMGPGTGCRDCTPAAVSCAPTCPALPASVAGLMVALLVTLTGAATRGRPRLGHARLLDPPPRPV